MPRGHLSVRVDAPNRHHHLWNNNGVWWVRYTLHFDCRTRRVRRSLKTGSLDEAIRRRDDLFARLQAEGEDVPERATASEQSADQMPTPQRWLEILA